MLTIIDYGIGNLRSIEKAFESVGVTVLRTDRPADVAAATHLVLPGVGAFGACIDEIRRRNLEAPVLEYVASGRPFLGVCVGMQLLFEYGEEMGRHRGLGILPGKVVRFSWAASSEPVDCDVQQPSDVLAAAEVGRPLKVPHMGWNTVHAQRPSPLLAGIDDGAYFYFVHSYHAVADDPADVLASTHYGDRFPAIVQRNNVYGVQFHPEKSQRSGLDILLNFSKL